MKKTAGEPLSSDDDDLLDGKRRDADERKLYEYLFETLRKEEQNGRSDFSAPAFQVASKLALAVN